MFFLPYQQRWLRDRSRLKLMEKSRQIGLSWTAAYGAVRRAAQQAAPPAKPLDVWVSSRDALQARLFLGDCRRFAAVLQAASPHSPVISPQQRPNAESLAFASGATIHSLSSNADAQAGKRGHRILDEFALHPNPRELYAIAYPGITWGGQLEIISTHRGSANFFHQLVRQAREQGNPMGLSLHRVTLPDALRDGFLARLQSRLSPDDPRQAMDDDAYLQFVRNGCADEESWRQEYLCEPADDATAFLPYADITGCEVASDEPWQVTPAELAHPTHGGPLFLGVDVGRERDRTVFWLLELLGDVVWTRRLIVLERMPFAQQEEHLDTLLGLPRLRRACVDATGLGRQFAERAAQRWGGHRVEGITMTLPLQEALAWPVRTALESRRLRLPPNDAHLRADLRSLRRETTLAGHTRFAAERSALGHADRFWALALALHAVGKAAPELRRTASSSVELLPRRPSLDDA